MIKLKLSIIIFILMLIITFFGEYISPYTIDFQENIRTEVLDGILTTTYSPHKPDLIHIFGTNNWGFDQLAIVLHGMKFTLFIAVVGTLIRFVLGLLIALPQSFKYKEIKKDGIVSIPVFIIAYFFLFRISFESSLPYLTLIFIQILVIAILGLPSTISSIRANTVLILKEGYIEAAYSCGSSNFRIMYKHIIPNLIEKLYILFLSEMINILNIVGQFGIFNLFIGGTKVSLDPRIYYSVSNELAGLVGQWRGNIYHNEWLVLFPLLAYLFILFSFHFLLSSLENYNRIKKNY